MVNLVTGTVQIKGARYISVPLLVMKLVGLPNQEMLLILMKQDTSLAICLVKT